MSYAAAPERIHTLRAGVRRCKAPLPGRSPGVNVAPGPHDDGWIEPPPVRLADGTAVQLYKDGQLLRAAYDAIGAARQSIRLEVYIFHDDSTGRAFAELLAKRAREGLDVTLLFDSVGSAGTDPAMFQSLRRAGVRLREFHPWQPWRTCHGWRPFNRDHRKLLVVDGKMAALGGQNLGNEYGSSWVVGQPHDDAWRDTGAGFDGPSVRLLWEAYSRIWNYARSGGPIHRAEFIASAESFRRSPDGSLLDAQRRFAGGINNRLGPSRSVLDVPPDSMAVLASVPSSRNRLLPSLRKLLRDARSSIEITMAYFAPAEQLINQLCESARGGVRVRLMLPARSDVPLLVAAARAFYEKLMAAGVEIYERQYAVLHAKTLCVDRRLSVVGSTNLDYRSIQHNCELSAVVHSRPFAAQMQALFEHDVCFARRILPDEWRYRPARDRIVQWAVTRAQYLL